MNPHDLADLAALADRADRAARNLAADADDLSVLTDKLARELRTAVRAAADRATSNERPQP